MSDPRGAVVVVDLRAAARRVSQARDRFRLWLDRLRRQNPAVYDAMIFGSGLLAATAYAVLKRETER